MKARLLSIALAICMALSLTPVAYAAEGDTAGGAGGTTDNQIVANVTGSNQVTTQHTSLDDALDAVAESGGTIELLNNATMAQGVTIKGDVTIKGNGYTIKGSADNAAVNFTVDDNGTLAMANMTLDGFGSSVGTKSGIAVVKVKSGKINTKVVATGVNVSNFCRSAYDIRSGEFEITGGTIDCGGADTGTDTNSRLTKGILAGLGTGQVSGTVNNVTIKNSNSNYSDWSSAGIEIYQNANVTINGGKITDVQNGVSVDNYYAANGDNNTGAVVKIEATSIGATDKAIRVYGDGGDDDIGTTANVTVDGGEYVGDIAIINGTTSSGSSAKKETISISHASIKGDIDNVNGVMGFVRCNITGASENAANIDGVTFIDTTVNDKTMSTNTESDVALLNGTLYETLKDAVEAAKDDDTITILPGTHVLDANMTITLNKKITIEGYTNSKKERAVIECKGTNTSGHGLFTLEKGSEGSVLDGFDINYTATERDCAAIYLNAGFDGDESKATRIQNMNIAGGDPAAEEQAIGILSTYGAEGPLVVVANTFSNLKYGMYFNQITDLTVKNNIIDNTRYNAINIAADRETYPCSNITIAYNELKNISSADYEDDTYSSGVNMGVWISGVRIADNSITMLNGKKPINVVQPSGGQTANRAVITYQVKDADYAVFIVEIDDSGTATYVPPQNPKVPGYTFEEWNYGDAKVTIDKNANAATVIASSEQMFTFTAILKPVSSGGPGGGGVTTPSYDVTIAQPEGGTVSVDPTDAEAGEEVTVTVKPDEGLTLGDLIVTDEDGNTVKVAANEDGTYSFEMPEGDVTITATFVCDGGALCPTDKFTDIDQAQWYHFAIDWVVENGVMNGIGGTTLFAPDDDLLREQAATVMWNIMAEGDLEAPAAALSDVAQGEWYAPYVNWAVEAAVMEGHGGTDRFGVGEALTREQFAAVVAKATNADVSAADATALEGFTDSESVSEWAQATMAWAVEAGVINGVALSDGTLELQGSREITRAEMAMMIKNAVDEGVLEL
ncbi:MAG TPA: S-layer homology domain-containing protein [Candidatus Aveggerthella stercoripullorum]|uniref:S-layer homology domain-containing protein n=1 Tax=Candidatus Aveggerthella stercoripullorum TaxID=2840688 RepID=A0A9D0ZZA3_9ACTN|nr:S-layer homology domain-containing protein [Candidatus Aveggerthella stercoripullorum]